jgi:hypothetical protein
VEVTVKNIVCFNIICKLVATHILGTNKMYNKFTYLYTGFFLERERESPLLNTRIYQHATGCRSVVDNYFYSEAGWGYFPVTTGQGASRESTRYELLILTEDTYQQARVQTGSDGVEL